MERNPVTNNVESAADIQVTAEDTPLKVLDLMRLPKSPAQAIREDQIW